MLLKKLKLITDRSVDVAVMRTGALGDICMTLPLIRKLREHLTGKVTWIIDAKFYPLVRDCKGVDFIPIQKPRTLKDYRKLHALFQRYPHDVLLAPQSSFRANIMSVLFPAQRKIGNGPLHSKDLQSLFMRERVDAYPEHLVDAFMRFVEPFKIPLKEIDLEIRLDKNEVLWANQCITTQKKVVAICPLSSKAERNWPIDRIIKVMSSFTEDEVVYVLIGDKSATRVTSKLDQSVSHHCYDLAGKLTLRQLAAILHRSDVLLTPDTGPMHIADAVGTKSVGLFAVASAKKTGPYRYREGIIDKYQSALKQYRSRVTQPSWGTRVHHKKAMHLIEVEEVVDKIHDMLYKNFN